MPGGDKTGPVGAGPMTGRGAGYCAGFGRPGYINPGFARGGGFGQGRRGGFGNRGGAGRGWRRMFWGADYSAWPSATGPFPYETNVSAGRRYSRNEELRDLKSQADYLNDALAEINRRIEDLERERKG
jgi:hypothetical protein